MDIKSLRGQGYDGAANMAIERVGVQSRIRGHAPLASYTHCAGHCLNLVVVHSCKTRYIKNTLDKMQAVYAFFLNSPKRNGLLEEIAGRQTLVFEGNRRKSLIDLCKTRWAERQIASTFTSALHSSRLHWRSLPYLFIRTTSAMTTATAVGTMTARIQPTPSCMQ